MPWHYFLSVHSPDIILSERGCACTWSWESDICSSTSSLLPSYAWAEAVVYLPTSHKRPMLQGEII